MRTYIDTPEDVLWLKQTHLRGVILPEKWHDFKCAILHGNESGPDAVDLYLAQAPDVQDAYLKIELEPLNITEVS